jgi:phosphate transport system permease protein
LNVLLTAMAMTVAALLMLIVLFLLRESWPFIEFVWQQHAGHAEGIGAGWYPLEGQFDLTPMMLASLAVTLGAIVLALPLGLACAVFLEMYATRRLAAGFRTVLNLLAGVPSVVFGLWGLTRLVPLITQWQPPGTSLLAATLVLALMILPTIALTSASALASVPRHLISAALALGLRRHTLVLHVLLPAARTGIGSGVLLATARALGETMAVLMVAGNVVQNPTELLAPVRALTANIALEMAYAMDAHRASLFASGLLLTAVVWLLSWAAHRVNPAVTRSSSHG